MPSSGGTVNQWPENKRAAPSVRRVYVGTNDEGVHYWTTRKSEETSQIASIDGGPWQATE